MRKRLMTRNKSAADHGWLDLEKLAQVEVTSEDASVVAENVVGV
jgi:hypothetical protein